MNCYSRCKRGLKDPIYIPIIDHPDQDRQWRGPTGLELANLRHHPSQQAFAYSDVAFSLATATLTTETEDMSDEPMHQETTDPISRDPIHLDTGRCVRAVQSKDARFDGWFFTAVLTTRIYCRPSCPVVPPKPEHMRFYRSAAAAQQAGFRACKRCRPDASPGSPEWDVRADVVARGMRLIADGVMDNGGVPALADRLGYSVRQVERQLLAELGAGPLALARAQRAQTARLLIETTTLPMGDVAFAAGFASVRTFNDTVKDVFALSPTELRDRASRTSEADVAAALAVAALAFGGVDLVVNNAGLSISKPLTETTLADWDILHDVMARGSFLVSREAAKVMEAQAMGGDIIYIVSKNGVFAGPSNVAYGAAKADQAHQVRLLAAELGAIGVRVNGINPDGVVRGSGIFAGGWGARRAAVYGVPEEELGAYYAQRTLLKKEVLPEHIAAAVFALTGGDLPLTTGLLIPVDAGVAAAFLR